MAKTAILALGLALASGGLAQQEVIILPERSSLAPSTTEFEFTPPPYSVEHQVRLRLLCRIDKDRLAGSNPWIRIAVNGNWLTEDDLLNKANDFTLVNGLDLTWCRNGDHWRVLYSPDFEAAIQQAADPYAMSSKDADPYRFVWSITPYLKPGPNQLTIQHLKILAEPSTLVLKDVAVEVGKSIEPPATAGVQPAPAGPVPAFVAQQPYLMPMQVGLRADGGLQVVAAGQTFEISTKDSLPDGKWRETRPDSPLRPVSGGGVVSWQQPGLAVERQVIVERDHLAVRDTFTNTSNDLLGVIHRLQVSRPTATDVRLGGRQLRGEQGKQLDAAQPSVFAGWDGGGLGLVAEDDVFRVHVSLLSGEGWSGLEDARLGLTPGQPVTLEWSLYPMPADYWQFVNAVRRNWDTNFAIPGPFYYTMHLPENQSAEWYGQWARDRGLQITCGGIAKYAAGKYAHGTGILSAPEFVAKERDWTRKMMAAAPEVKALAYFHAQCCTEPGGTETYAADRLRDSSGKALSYPYRYDLPLYLPTADNTYGKALWGYVDCLLDEIGTAGIYWDEMSHSVLSYAGNGDLWDGSSVIISPKSHAILRKDASVPLMMQGLELAIVKHVRDQGKFVMANTQPMTRTMLRQKIVRFVETGAYQAVVGTHLGCPLGLGNHHAEDSMAARMTCIREILKRGALYYGHQFEEPPPGYNILPQMYPITPVELHAGAVLGEERIWTATSGRFGWPDGAAATVIVVDQDGEPVDGEAMDVGAGGQHLYELRMPSDHWALLIRQ